MKRMLAALSVFFVTVLATGLAFAAKPTVRLEHKLTGITRGETGVTVNYSLHISNPGDLPLTDLTLSLVPHPPLVRDRVSVSVGSLAPHQEADLPLQVVTPVPVDAQHISVFPLFWKGSYIDAEGKRVEFPAVSKTGGAQ
jgi:hypothetical protein